MSALPRQRVLPDLYQAAKRGCMIAGSDRGLFQGFPLRFDGPDELPFRMLPSGALRQSRRSSSNSSGGFAVKRARVARKCLMSGRVNWSRLASRKRMRRQGVEDVKGATPIEVQPLKKPRRKLSKAELREQAAAAFLAWREGQTSKNK